MPLKPATLLDSNAGAPLHPVVVEALLAFLAAQQGDEACGNPASAHSYGRRAQDLILKAESAILQTFRASPREWAVTFTSGGTEANQLAVRTALASVSRVGRRPRWLLSAVEHSCVRDLRAERTEAGDEVFEIPVSMSGEAGDIPRGAGADTLISVIGVGNETGIHHHSLTSHILSESLRSNERPSYHTDYVAAWGKAELDLAAPGAPDWVAIAGHKLGALAGSGALIHRRSTNPERAGTPNLLGIASLKALAENWDRIVREGEGLRPLRDSFEAELLRRVPQALFVGRTQPRVSHVSSFYIPGAKKNLSLVPQLDLRGFAVSAGSACASQIPEPSHVLRAMGISDVDAQNAIRISLHPGNTPEDLTGFLDALTAILKRNEVL